MSERYEILWPHARGGLGQIYVAQDRELNRRVALKEIQQQLAKNPINRERFVIEAQITGRLEHPGIVPVYGMGWQETDGRPYYAMRFINGEDLTTAIRRFHASVSADFAGLEFRWLLRRFIDVCNTIAYAHSRGVLHRDIKPSNIMLGPFGETLVMDWGVAKPMRQSYSAGPDALPSTSNDEPIGWPHGGSSSITVTGQSVGTPAYMSPEQAAGEIAALGPASDVYSLGATLYTMLTCRPPSSGVPASAVSDVRLDRSAAPRALQSRVPRALNAVCRKAMAEHPAKRYSSALALADDIERWLADEPVAAWRDPWLTYTRRWGQRHQPLVAGIAAAVVVALGALGLAVPLLSIAWQNQADARRNEQKQRILAIQKADEAEEQRASALRNLQEADQQRALALAHQSQADEERQRAEKALKILVDAFRKPDPAADGRSLKVVDLLDRTVKELDVSLIDQPLMRATLLSAIGETFSGLGMAQEALALFEKAFTIRRTALGEDHPETLRSAHSVAMTFQDRGRFDRAIPLLASTLAQRQAKLGDDHNDTIESMNDLAVTYWKAGMPRMAIPLYEATLARVRAIRGEADLDALTITDNLAVAYAAAGMPDRAIPLHEFTLGRFQAKLGDDHPTTLVALNNMAQAYKAANRLGEAIMLREATSVKLRTKLGEDHPTTLTVLNGLAAGYRDAGRLDEAESVFRVVLANRQTKLGGDHPDTLFTTFLLAKLEFEAHRPDQAVPLARKFVERATNIAGRLPANVRNAIPRAAELLVSHYRLSGQTDLAERYRRIQQLQHSAQFATPKRSPAQSAADAPLLRRK
jgi:serine/threonine protein kinase